MVNVTPFQNHAFDVRKFDALVHYVCGFVEDPSLLGATKLNKTIWYSDVVSFLETGRSITGVKYIKHQFGPVPNEIMQSRNRLVQEGKIVERQSSHFGLRQTQFVVLSEPDVSQFSSAEIVLVDRIASVITRGHTATSISKLTHDSVWEAAEIGEEIPLYAVLGAELGEVTADDMKWAITQAASL